MKANDFDEYFDDGGSVMPFADMSKAERPNVKTKRVQCGLPRMDGRGIGQGSRTPWRKPSGPREGLDRQLPDAYRPYSP